MSINISKSSRSSYLLSTSIVLAHPIEEIFQFFSEAENLELLTPKFLNFKICSQLPIQMMQGSLIDYQIRLYGIPTRWKTLIQEWHPPNQFIDKQLTGPFLTWEHTHEFRTLENNSTQMNDIVEYKVPGGSFVNAIFVKKRLLSIFEYRSSVMQDIFRTD